MRRSERPSERTVHAGERDAVQNARDKQAAFSRTMTYRSVAQAQSAYERWV